MTAQELFEEVCGYKRVPQHRLRWPYLICYEKKNPEPRRARFYVRFKLDKMGRIRIAQWCKGGMTINLVYAMKKQLDELYALQATEHWHTFIETGELYGRL